MSYNLTRGSVLRNKPQLDQLVEAGSKQANMVFWTHDSSNLAYKLREARKAALKFEEFSDYHSLEQDFKFKEYSDRLVAIYQSTLGEIIETQPSSRTMETNYPPVNAITKSPAPSQLTTKSNPKSKSNPNSNYLEIDEAESLMAVMALAVINESVNELHFPHAALNYDEKVKLYEWIKKYNWRLIDHDGRGLTLTRDKNIPEEVLWKA